MAPSCPLPTALEAQVLEVFQNLLCPQGGAGEFSGGAVGAELRGDVNQLPNKGPQHINPHKSEKERFISETLDFQYTVTVFKCM